MRWFVFVLLLAAVIADVYIYRSVICWHFHRLPPRIAYIVFALVTNGAALVAFFYVAFTKSRDSAGMIAVMWLVWVFFLTALPKLIFAVGVLLDFIVSFIIHHRVIVFRGVALVVSLAAAVTMVWGATIGRTRLKINEVEIHSPRIPAAFDGYRIAQISDIHLGTMPCAEKRLARLVETMSSLAPDMVANTGDLVNTLHTDFTQGMAAELSRMAAPDGVWNVWGNHDLGFYARGGGVSYAENLSLLTQKVQSMGWRTLVNESVYIRRGSDSILLSGVGYPQDNMTNGRANTLAGADIGATFAGIHGDPFSIVLAHTPRLWGRITGEGRGDLTLSGHTHAMQLKINFSGISWSPAQYMYDEWSGLYRKINGENSALYVNNGIGCVGYPMRIGTRPEITLFILKRCE